ncbi:hypothetical protein ScPMuIL_009854 [Solemya velum]
MYRCFQDRESRGTYVLSTSFLCVYTAYLAIQNLQSSLNKAGGLGTTSLAVLYCSGILSSSLAPLAIKTVGCKNVVIAAWLCHVIYTATNFYPHWWTLIPSSVILGTTSGFLWTTQGVYLSRFSFSLSERLGTDRNIHLNRLNGIFFSIYHVSGLSGNIISSTVLYQGSQNETRGNFSHVCGADICPGSPNGDNFSESNSTLLYILLGIFLVCGLIGLLLTVFLLPAIDASLHMQSQSVGVSILACVRGLQDTRLLLLAPVMVFVAFNEGILWADYMKAYVSCPLGIRMVGFVMAVNGVVTTGVSLVVGRIAKYTGRQAMLATGLIINAGIACIMLSWQPEPNHIVYIFLIPAFWALAGSIWKIQMNVTLAAMFPDRLETTFALFQSLKACGYASSFMFSTTTCVSVKLYTTLALILISSISYTATEIKHARLKSSTYVLELVVKAAGTAYKPVIVSEGE